MPEPVRRKASYEDLLGLPEQLVGEILGGELHTHPRPAPRHARAYSALGGNLWDPFDYGKGGPGGWWILDEPELHLGEDIVVPDLAGWRRERMAELPETAWFGLAPDWACEILSPATARIDRALKMSLYAREGVPFTLAGGPRCAHAGGLPAARGASLAAPADTQGRRAPAPAAVRCSGVLVGNALGVMGKR